MGVVDRMSAALGVEVDGLDLRTPTEQHAQDVRSLLDEHMVVAVRDQYLTAEQHMALTALLGRPWIHPVERLLGKPASVPVTVEARHTDPLGTDRWHVDFPYLPSPPAVGVLCALDMPSYGGDTTWVNMQLGYATLRDDLRERLTGRTIVHSVPESFIDRRAGDDPFRRGVWKRVCVGTRHPAVQTHPSTGRLSVYTVDRNAELEDLEPEPARSLMAAVADHVTHLNHTCRWRWRRGDVVFYDQRSTFHRLIMDPWPGVRRMRRTLVEGQRPFFAEAVAG